MSPELKIIWAVDPSVNPKMQKAAIGALRALAARGPTVIQPVYLLSAFMDSEPSPDFAGSIDLIRASVEAGFRKIASGAKLSGLRPLTVLTGTSLSAGSRSIELTDYAFRERADLILLATHGRTGASRWLLGSFAEAMMRQMKLPLLIVNARWSPSTRLDHITFPTDFSGPSHEAYRMMLGQVIAARAPITLFHRIQLTVSPELHLLVSTQSAYRRMVQQAAADCRARAEIWAQEGRDRGAKVKVVIDDHATRPVADAILRQRLKTGGLIAIASRSGDFNPFLAGRTTLEVVRQSPSATWVLHPMGQGALEKTPPRHARPRSISRKPGLPPKAAGRPLRESPGRTH